MGGIALMVAVSAAASAATMPEAAARRVIAEVQDQLYLHLYPDIRLDLVEAYLSIDDLPSAKKVAEAIQTPELRYQGYKVIGVALAEKGDLDAARAYVEKLAGDRWQGGVVLAIAAWQARHGDAEAAAQTLANQSSDVYGDLRTPSSKAASIARDLAAGGYLAKAHQVIKRAEPFERASALEDIGLAEHTAGRASEAHKSLRAALDSIKAVPDQIGRRVLLESVAKTLLTIGANEDVRVALLALRFELLDGPSWEQPARELLTVALLFRQSGDERDAHETLRMVGDRVAKDGSPSQCPAPIQDLARHYAYRGEIDAALDLAKRAPSDRWREAALVEVVGALAFANDLVGARKLADSLKNDSTRNAAYATMAEAAALKGDDTAAFALVYRIEGRARLPWAGSVARRTYPLYAIAVIAAYGGRMTTMQRAVDALETERDQDSAYANLAEIAAARGDFGGAVDLAHKIGDRNNRLASPLRLVTHGGRGAPSRPERPGSRCFFSF